MSYNPNVPKKIVVDISSAQLLDIWNTPVVLLPSASTSGLQNVPVTIVFETKFNTIAYWFAGTSLDITNMMGLFGTIPAGMLSAPLSISQIGSTGLTDYTIGMGWTPLDNLSLVSQGGQSLTDGDWTLRITIWYYQVPIY